MNENVVQDSLSISNRKIILQRIFEMIKDGWIDISSAWDYEEGYAIDFIQKAMLKCYFEEFGEEYGGHPPAFPLHAINEPTKYRTEFTQFQHDVHNSLASLCSGNESTEGMAQR